MATQVCTLGAVLTATGLVSRLLRRAGPQILDFDVADALPAAQAPVVAHLTLVSLGDAAVAPQVLPLIDGENIVGRVADCDVVLPYGPVSTKHAVIDINAAEGMFTVKDLRVRCVAMCMLGCRLISAHARACTCVCRAAMAHG